MSEQVSQLDAVTAEAAAMRSIARNIRTNVEKVPTPEGKARVVQYAESVLAQVKGK